MEELPIYILAGGRSSRFGSDKARATVDELPMLTHVTRCLEPAATTITVVADEPDKYTDLGIKTIADIEPGQGPLGGLCTALQCEPQQTWILLVACDLLNLDITWINTLQEAAQEGDGAIAFRSERWEPLFAMYHTRILDQVEDALKAKQRTMWRFLDSIAARVVPLPENFHQLVVVNTPDELERYHLRPNP